MQQGDYTDLCGYIQSFHSVNGLQCNVGRMYTWFVSNVCVCTISVVHQQIRQPPSPPDITTYRDLLTVCLNLHVCNYAQRKYVAPYYHP